MTKSKSTMKEQPYFVWMLLYLYVHIQPPQKAIHTNISAKLKSLTQMADDEQPRAFRPSFYKKIGW